MYHACLSDFLHLMGRVMLTVRVYLSQRGLEEIAMRHDRMRQSTFVFGGHTWGKTGSVKLSCTYCMTLLPSHTCLTRTRYCRECPLPNALAMLT